MPRAEFTGVPENETKTPAPSIAGLIPPVGLPLALFETSDALVTETLIIPEEETSFEGTFTTIVWHCAMLAVPVGQFTGAETDEGESVSLLKRTFDVISRPVPVIPSGKFPLPARTLVGEIEKMAGVLLEPETAVLPPHPRKEIAIPATAPRRITSRCMFHHHRLACGTRPRRHPRCQQSSMIEEREAGSTTRKVRCRTIRLGLP